MMIDRPNYFASRKVYFSLAVFKKKAIFSPESTIQG
ncbi:hypothetical protein FHW04_002628 [Pantoea sp. AN62]|jgi:hypothetical protein